MDNKTRHILNQISASIPKHLKEALMKKEKNADMDTISEALISKTVSKENKAKLKRIQDGMIRKQATVVDSAIEREIDNYLSTKIEQAIRQGKIPKATRDDFMKEMEKKTAK